jgi:hypothetical protein
MDYLLTALETVAAGLALVLAVIALFAAQRYSERRFVFVGVGLGALGVVSLLGLVDIVADGTVPGSGLGYPTVILLLVAEALLYLSLVAKRTVPRRLVDG